MESTPKLFISYSWTSEEHIRWVIQLATDLRNNGVDVKLDKWELREGNDTYHFMEKMVADPAISKVIMVCDQRYVEKANERDGGVGTETQIISAKIYAKTDQNKFVAVISEKANNGESFVPTYYKSRIYIDLSSDDLYSNNFEQLLRWAHDVPKHVKPPLGEKPDFLSDTAKPSLGTTALLNRALDAVRNNKPNRSGACSEYLEYFSSSIETFRIRIDYNNSHQFDSEIIESIEEFVPYRDEAIRLFMTLGSYDLTSDEQSALHRFFESICPYMFRPKGFRGMYHECDYDNFKFVLHELFLYAIAALLRYRRFQAAAQLIGSSLYVGQLAEGNGGISSFVIFRQYMKSLEHRNSRLKMNRLSLRSDLLKDRATFPNLTFLDLMQADFTLYVRNCLDSFRNNHRVTWWPETLLYAESEVYHGPFEIFSQSQSKQYFNEVKCLFSIADKQSLEPVFEFRAPAWEWDTFDPKILLGYDRLATSP